MFNFVHKPLVNSRVHRYELRCGASPVTYGETLQLWRSHESFRLFFGSILLNSPLAAFRWETPPGTTATIGRPFEFVLLDAPRLNVRADPRAFDEHFVFATADQRVVTFSNLGNDAMLIVPRPDPQAADFGHLAAFLRNASLAQQHELWAAVGATVESKIGDEPVWLSTAGMGVPWLHVRVDSRPKYYDYEPYRRF